MEPNECLDTAVAGTFYKVKGKTKENIPTLPCRHNPSSHINRGEFELFRRRSSDGNNNFLP